MKIAVCIKQVPDTTEIRIDPVKKTLIRTGVPSIMNPFDVNAVEAALELKDRYGGEVTVISMGPGQAKAILREAIAMGADHAYLVTDRAFGGSDTYATSYILSQTLRKFGPFDIILGGKQAIDGDTGQTAPSIAEHLGAARLTYVLDLKVEGDKVIAHRQIEEGSQVTESKMPVLCTVTKETNVPRYPTLRRKLYSLRCDIPEVTLADMPEGFETGKIGLNGSPTRVKYTFTPERSNQCEKVEGSTSTEIAQNLIAKLTAAKAL